MGVQELERSFRLVASHHVAGSFWSQVILGVGSWAGIFPD